MPEERTMRSPPLTPAQQRSVEMQRQAQERQREVQVAVERGFQGGQVSPQSQTTVDPTIMREVDAVIRLLSTSSVASKQEAARFLRRVVDSYNADSETSFETT